jgi:G3E family GTPase
MSETRGTGTELMSVSIVAGPAAQALLARLELSPRTIVEQPSGVSPDQVIERMRSIAAEGRVDDLIIHCEPDRLPMAYASLFAANDQADSSLANVARLKTNIFVIGTPTFLDAILDRATDSVPACFMAEQMEFVDRIVFDDGSADFDLARSIAIAMNPRAQVSRLSDLNNQWWQTAPERSFDFNASLTGAGWRQLLEGEQKAPTDGRVTAIGYSARRPFHPERFSNFLRQKSHVFRAKGFFWLASRMDEVGGLNLAGADLHCSSAGGWWATRDAESRNAEMPEHAREQWREPFGDRRQTFAVMALDVDRESLKSTLDACLLADDEMNQGLENWKDFPDPFPSWSHHHHHHSHECDHEHDHEHDGGDEHHCCQH